jgi:hypothetical protein
MTYENLANLLKFNPIIFLSFLPINPEFGISFAAFRIILFE